ncbi:nitroreductase [Salipaludibacillus sp. HK11]|uniref:nitroreductase family protein n=1 Tax=Salipaludibacillus sp. HK11 TaxID=3394320 RepID=UPI0039FDDF13
MTYETESMKEVSSIAKTIRERRTIREFKSDPVSVEAITDILNDAVWAPNHGFREPWRFILFQGEAKEQFIEAVSEASTAEQIKKWGEMKAQYYRNVPIHLVVVMKEDPRQKQWEEDFSATSALIQNFQLLAWEKNIGVVWKTNGYNFDPRFHKAIGIEPGEKIVGTLHVGYFDKKPKAKPRTDIEKKLTIVPEL